jgi:hypothetical protein
MHGVTKELHKLVIAARRFDELADVDAGTAFPDGEPGIDTERVYFQLLRELATHGRRLSVTIDIIAGTSAGGINGICLGKVIARNGSQEKLKRLWIDEGDLKKLLRAPAIGGWRLQAVLAALPVIARPRRAGSPLRGERMSRLLFDAISEMERQRGQLRSLIKPGATLDLFVTTTDLHGYEVLVPTGVGGASQRDRNYAQVMEFQSGPEAARSTRAAPGRWPSRHVPRPAFRGRSRRSAWRASRRSSLRGGCSGGAEERPPQQATWLPASPVASATATPRTEPALRTPGSSTVGCSTTPRLTMWFRRLAKSRHRPR